MNPPAGGLARRLSALVLVSTLGVTMAPPAAAADPVVVPGSVLAPARAGVPEGDQEPAGADAARLRAAVESALRGQSPPPSTPATPDRPVLAFAVGAFNILGHAHTARGGNKAAWPDSPGRSRAAADLIRGSGVSVLGLSEVEPTQLVQLRRLLPAWRLWPLRGDARWGRQPIAWDTRAWSRVSADAIQVPYLRGRPIWIPYVLLRHRATDRVVWFVNTHNPADARGPAEHLRDRAERRQIALINRLRATAPVIFTGDMNDTNDFLCHVAPRTGMTSADGGGALPGGGCRKVSRPGIDWVLGTEEVEFSGYVRDFSAWQRRIADHPYVHALATIN